MNGQSQRMILVATDEGLHVVDGEGPSRVDDLAGRAVPALAVDGEVTWAIVGGRELWRSEDGIHWSETATVPKRKAACLGSSREGLLVGTARAHLLRLEQDRLVSLPSFDDAEGRGE